MYLALVRVLTVEQKSLLKTFLLSLVIATFSSPYFFLHLDNSKLSNMYFEDK
jgi:hypothetical protein